MWEIKETRQCQAKITPVVRMGSCRPSKVHSSVIGAEVTVAAEICSVLLQCPEHPLDRHRVVYLLCTPSMAWLDKPNATVDEAAKNQTPAVWSLRDLTFRFNRAFSPMVPPSCCLLDRCLRSRRSTRMILEHSTRSSRHLCHSLSMHHCCNKRRTR